VTCRAAEPTPLYGWETGFNISSQIIVQTNPRWFSWQGFTIVCSGQELDSFIYPILTNVSQVRIEAIATLVTYLLEMSARFLERLSILARVCLPVTALIRSLITCPANSGSNDRKEEHVRATHHITLRTILQ
jgi:hypothetical protein